MTRTISAFDGHLFNRVVRPSYDDPFDTSYARDRGGRWNPPGQFDTLYLNDDLPTARNQIVRMLEGSAVEPDDLTDDAYELAGCRLPEKQQLIDVRTDAGVKAVGLPPSYPTDDYGRRVPHEVCQHIGRQAYERDWDGVSCRSAAILDGRGRETAWWPRGRPVEPTGQRVPYGHWRHDKVTDLSGMLEQPPS